MCKNKNFIYLIVKPILYRYEIYNRILFAILMCSLFLNFKFLSMKPPAKIVLKSSDNIIKVHEKLIYQNRIENRIFKNKVNCDFIMNNETTEIDKAKRLLVEYKNEYKKINEGKFIFDKSYCPLFREIRGYDSHPITQSEYEFPLAFSILVYYNVEQLERFLKLIYRPQNVYCIHIDYKSSFEIHKAIQSIVQCFDNVFISSRLEDVIYAGFSRLKADINCMHDLINFKNNFTYNNNKTVPKWKYFINLASTEFPLRTNYELTEILRLFNGANDIEVLLNNLIDRVKYSYVSRYKNNQRALFRTNLLKDPPPYNFTIKKGSAFGHFSHDFVKFVLNDIRAKELLKWTEDTYSPDEW